MKRSTSERASPSPEKREARAERLLAAMHKVFSHDLPNQLVIVQSLLTFLDDQLERLNDEGRDHLRRLQAAGRRAGDMVHFLKDMASLATRADPPEEVRLAALAREVLAQLTHLYPDRRLRLREEWDSECVVAGRSLHHALLRLLRAGMDDLPAHAVDIVLSSRRTPDRWDIDVSLAADPAEAADVAVLPPRPELPEERLDFVLARETLALGGASLISQPHPRPGASLRISLPRHNECPLPGRDGEG